MRLFGNNNNNNNNNNNFSATLYYLGLTLYYLGLNLVSKMSLHRVLLETELTFTYTVPLIRFRTANVEGIALGLYHS